MSFTRFDIDILKVYSEKNRSLIPISKKDPHKNKRPLDKNWQNKKYTANQIRQYVKFDYNLGWRLNRTDLVIDYDPRNDKNGEGFCKLQADWGASDLKLELPTVITGSGGFHFYLQKPQHLKVKNSISEYGKGVEFKSQGRQVIVAGSCHPNGKIYEFYEFSPYNQTTPECPNWLLEKIQYNPAESITDSAQINTKPLLEPSELLDCLEQLPVTEYAENSTWYPILVASHQATGGQGLIEFLEWSLSDPAYADQETEIKARWNSFNSKQQNGITASTLFKAVLDHKGKLPQSKLAIQDFDELSQKEKKESGYKRSKLQNKALQIAETIIIENFNSGRNILKDNQRRIHLYEKTHWRPEFTKEIEDRYCDPYCERFLLRLEPSNRPDFNAFVKKTAEVFMRRIKQRHEFFADVQELQPIFNCRNGEIHLASDGSFKRKRHSPKSYLTSCLDFDYKAKATCPLFDQTLQEIFQDLPDTKEVIRHLLELMAYTIQPKKDIAVWVLFKGQGSNGKSLILNLLQSFLSDAFISKPIKSLDISRNNHAFAQLPGKLLVCDDDVKSRTVLPDNTLKLLSENKVLESNPKGSNAFNFFSQATIFLCANQWPQVTDLSEGLRRRALVFNFNHTFSKSEIDLNRLDRLKEERSGILNTLLDSYKRLRNRGNFKVPRSCEKAFSLWFQDSNQILQFKADCLLDSKNKTKTPLDQIYAVYSDWASREGVGKCYSRNGLSRELESIGYVRYRGALNVIYFRNIEIKSGLAEKDFLE